ncbi:DMT family transporter [Chondromyces apiculatus]|uniref:Guanidinium exporter n=1 Tax=Chondromyces apiculatus DSM 436 TaxID=1192034 RepID=A0A017SXC2_9BACT|nr:quaternary ammonium compound efflux SMR transporter SugE [Chondromyces apiculatus]EYF01422.1 Quaternary ammonium compound-resistance protein SugE [Chondromyces apiculatus DSM 436]
MSWFLLVIAGLLETCWAVGMKYTEGFTKPLPTVLTVLAIIVSMALLGVAVRELPMGTAYAVWVAIGIVGTTLAGALLLGESLSLARMLFLALLLVSVVGLKLTTPAP